MSRKEVHMTNFKVHRLYVGIASILFFVIGLFLGDMLLASSGFISIEAVIVALVLANMVILLLLGSLVLEIREIVESKKRGK
jgi:hypothetical protein